MLTGFLLLLIISTITQQQLLKYLYERPFFTFLFTSMRIHSTDLAEARATDERRQLHFENRWRKL